MSRKNTATASNVPTGYIDVVLNNRDSSKDDGDLVWLERDAYLRLREWRLKGVTVTASKPAATHQKKSPLAMARLRIYNARIYSPGLHEINAAICAACDQAEHDAAKNMTRCKACGCAGETVTPRMGVVEKPPMDSPAEAVPSNFSSSSPTRCFHNKWSKLHFKNAEKPTLTFHLGASGLGDAIGGLYAACGLADSTGAHVVYYAHSANWLKRISHPGVEIRARVQNVKEMGVDGCYDDDYHRQIATGVSRVKCYAEKLAERLKVKPFEGTRPRSIDKATPAGAEEGFILLAPFSCYSSRDWDKFDKLALALEADGHKVMAMGSAVQGAKLEDLFRPTHAKYFWGLAPEDAISLVLRAKLVIGNDSGVAHLAGLFGIPALSIHAGSLPHDFLFDLSPSVRSVVADGQLPRSDHNTGALRSIPLKKVMDAVSGVFSPRIQTARERSLLSDVKFDALMRTLVGLVGVRGAVGELGVYKGGSTAAMAMAAPERTVYAFDTFKGIPNLAKLIDVHRAGDFADVAGVLEYLKDFPNVRTRPGIFPGGAEGVEEEFALVHLDADMYASTLAGLEWFWPRMVPGGKIVLDDWEWHRCPGVKRAVEEFFASVPHVRVITAAHQLTIEKPPDASSA